VGRRSRQRSRGAGGVESDLLAPSSRYVDDAGNVLELRASLTAPARREYAETLHGGPHRDDARQRAIELLFERLAVRWTVAGEPIERQRELLARYRAASPTERDFVRDSLRSHAEEHFPELEAP
jgi:hypothetical protein